MFLEFFLSLYTPRSRSPSRSRAGAGAAKIEEPGAGAAKNGRLRNTTLNSHKKVIEHVGTVSSVNNVSTVVWLERVVGTVSVWIVKSACVGHEYCEE